MSHPLSSFFFFFLKSHKSKRDYDRSLVLCWREAAVTVSCSDLTLLRLLWLNFRPNPVCYQCSGTMSGCLLSGSGVSKNRFFFFSVWSNRRGVEWSGHCSYICLAASLSLSPYLCVCTLCAKIQSIATPAVERGEGQQPHWRSWARQTDGDTENIRNTPQARHFSFHFFSRVNERFLWFLPPKYSQYTVKRSVWYVYFTILEKVQHSELFVRYRYFIRSQFGLETLLFLK